MPETRDHRSIVEAAEKAAGAGDYASAERLLREAAALQETSLGPEHQDLANTLNNLGIVCEITKKPEDAERFFRRAYSIAAATLDPDHPFVTTSRKNLEDFCRARGKPVELPPVKPFPKVSAAPPPVPVEPKPVRVEKTPVAIEKKPASASEGRWSPVAIGVLVAIALVVTFIATPLFRSKKAAEPSAAAAPAAAPADPVPAPVDPKISSAPSVAKPAAPAPPTPSRRAEAEGARTIARSAPVLVEARLCRNLATDDDWECVSPRNPAGVGPLFFYTRLKSPVDTTVQHRWYRGSQVRQVVELRVRANTIAGYRTYSRNTINDLDQSDWRVELRSSDGTLLKEIRFTVR